MAQSRYDVGQNVSFFHGILCEKSKQTFRSAQYLALFLKYHQGQEIHLAHSRSSVSVYQENS